MAAQTDQRYGWLGGKQRSGEALGDVILMGVRLYSPGIGRFLTVDPVQGGSSTDYDYAYQDPVNVTDLDGRCPPCAAAAAIGGGIAARFLIRQAAKHLAKKAARRNQHIRKVAGNPPARPKPGVTSKHRNSNAYKGRSWGYQINYTHRTRKGDYERVYKYGITSGVFGWIRAGQSLRQCVNSGRYNCRITKIKTFRDRYSARLWEYRSCLSYVRRYGVRPPGMDRSCR
jgi:RHS repeat-associated protein